VNNADTSSMLHTTLGAQIFERDVFLELYLPTKDRQGRTLPDHSLWVARAEKLMSMLFGGATREPDADGIWLNPETDETIRERTARVYSFTSGDQLSNGASSLRQFLHLFGKMTNQGEVAVGVNNTLFGIITFDS
jgi:hypothetical protein